MQFKASFVAAFLLATTPALGFTVPKDTQDGAYTVQRDNSGREVHTRADDVSSEAAVSRAIRSSHVKRDGLDEIDCFRDQEALVHDDVANAVRELRNQIGSGGSGLGSHKGLYSIVGDVVAYCCNNRSQGNTCYLSAQQESNTLITEKCGEDSPGYAYDSGAHLTYGYQHKSHDFCPGDDDDEACNPIEACEGKGVGDDCSFLSQGCIGGVYNPIAKGDCRPPEEDPNYPNNSDKIWCRGEW